MTDITLLELLCTLQHAILGDDGEPVHVLSDPLFADREGEIEWDGRRFGLRRIVTDETADVLDRYIQALEIQSGTPT